MSEQIRERKRDLRRKLHAARVGLDPTGERTARLWLHVRDVPAVSSASVVMVYEAVSGEPDASDFVAWCRSGGKTVVVTAASPTAPVPVAADVPDVVVVPGLGFSVAGARLGRGGGWYDRFLAGRRRDCVAIGVCFAEQLVDDLPTEDHDVPVDIVVTDVGRAGAAAR